MRKPTEKEKATGKGVTRTGVEVLEGGEGNRHGRSDQRDVGKSYLWKEKEENFNGFQIGLKIAQYRTHFSGLPLGLRVRQGKDGR